MTLDPAILSRLKALIASKTEHTHLDMVIGTQDLFEQVAEAVYHLAASVTREQCAKIAERHAIPGHSVCGPEHHAGIADDIRQQSQPAEPLRGQDWDEGP